jgi:hypothetical protein
MRSGEGPPADAVTAFAGGRGTRAIDRLWIYRRMYWHRQILALREMFPLLVGRVGDQAFDGLARRYLEARPSTDPRIEWLGAGLASFLDHEGGEHVTRELADLARLEWAEMEALLAADPAAVLHTLDVGPAAFSQSRLDLALSLRLVDVAHDPFPSDESSPAARYAVWRSGFRACRERLAPADADALAAAMAGATLAEVCFCFHSAGDPAASAFAALGRWLARGWVAAVHLPGGAASSEPTERRGER